MKKNKNKSNIKLLVTVLVLTLVVILGTTYAWLRITKSSETVNKIKAGSLEMTLDDTTSEGIKLVNEVPRSYQQGMKTEEYTFTLTNTGSTTNDYTIYLDDVLTYMSDDNQKVTITDDTKLEDSKIRYILLKDGETSSADKSKLLNSVTERIIDTGKIDKNQTIKYSLRVWIDSKAETEVMGKLFNAKLRVEASQVTTNPEEKIEASFSNDSWDTIYKNVKAGYGTSYNVGDTRMILNNWTVRLVNTTPCSKFLLESESACGFVIEFQDPLGEYKMNSDLSNDGGWPASELRNTFSSFFSYLQTELKDYVADTKVVSGASASDSSGKSTFTSIDKLYLLSPVEVFGDMPLGKNDFAIADTRQLDYYKQIGVTSDNSSGVIKKRKSDGSYLGWWFRTAKPDTAYAFYNVHADFLSDDGANSNLRYAFPVFRIG